jgi:predicted RND superfamily exporter protein
MNDVHNSPPRYERDPAGHLFDPEVRAALTGRVYAAASTIVTVPQTVSIALGAGLIGLIGLIGYRSLLAAMAVVMALAAGWLLVRAPRPVNPGSGSRSSRGSRMR